MGQLPLLSVGMVRCHAMSEPAKLPTGYAARAATLEDLASVLELIVECDVADYGDSDETEVLGA